MERYGIPTARAGAFADAVSASRFAASLGGRCAVKADGLALGKGVLICQDMAQADQAIEEVLVRKAFGTAGTKIVIQEFLEGMEISLHALCDGRTAKLFPTSQDHKRALEGDQGLNTGGMGACSPAPFLNERQLFEVKERIIGPWLSGCAAEGIDFRGILYPGVMLTKEGPKVLEFNARFGDPETQVYLTRLDSDLAELLEASVGGTLDHKELQWSFLASVCVVMASGGYPGSYAKGNPISGLADAAMMANTKVFHAGTAQMGDGIVERRRVLGVTAWAPGLAERGRLLMPPWNEFILRARTFGGTLPPKRCAIQAESWVKPAASPWVLCKKKSTFPLQHSTFASDELAEMDHDRPGRRVDCGLNEFNQGASRQRRAGAAVSGGLRLNPLELGRHERG